MKLKTFAIIFLTLYSITACAESAWIKQLSNCQIKIKEETIQLPLTPPCTLAVKDEGEPQIRNIGDRKIAIILGAPASKKIASQWNMKESDQCSTESVAIALSDLNKPTAVSKPARNSFLCPTIHIDQVFFMSYKW